jgi:hypothetical protein
MKRFFVFIFLLFIFSSKSYAALDGRGELQLTDQAVNSFINYIKGDTSKGKSLFNKPMSYWISNDGNLGFWWYCPYERCNSNGSEERRICENESNQSCSRFARGRYVRWDNGINPKGKAAKFNSKMTENEIRNKLTKLGFYNNNITANSEINDSKDEITSKDKSILEQLEALTQMFKDGLISEEEFQKAKKKILN